MSAARAHVDRAVERTNQIRHRPQLALSRLELAELLLDHFPSEASLALEHLRAAKAEFEALDMRPALARAGLTNRDVAEALMITEGTAEVHVKHILGKLGFKSRHQVAVWAVEHELAQNR